MPIPALQHAGVRPFGAALPASELMQRRPGTAGRVMRGLAWGLVPRWRVDWPPLALFAGEPGQGAEAMLAVGVGTLPNLRALGMLAGRRRGLLDATALRCVVAAILLAFVLIGLWRAYHADGALTQGPSASGPW
jgi:sulfite exporter TauE/SafE